MRILPPSPSSGQEFIDQFNRSSLQVDADRLARAATRLWIGCLITMAVYTVAGIAYAIVKGGAV